MCDGASGYPGIPPNVANCNWWQDYNDWLVTNQNANGSWSGYSYWTDPLSTAFDITILSAIQINIIQCDVTGGQNVPDGFVDKLDLALISKSRGQAPVPPKDVFDTNKDGVINAEDVKICIPKCTLANCAITPVGTQPN